MPPVDAGSIYSEVRIALDKLKSDIAEVDVQFDKLTKVNDESSSKVEKSWSEGFKKINIEGLALVAGLTVAVKAAADAFLGFEESFARVRANMQGSKSDLDKVEQSALRMGQVTSTSATQAADALLVLARAGFTADESIEILYETQRLAEASASSMGDAVKLMSVTLRQLGLDSSEAGRVANVFAAARMPVQDLSGALQSLGPVLKGMNVSLEQSVAIIKLLSRNGVESGAAAMSLKMILGDLSDSASPLVKKLGELGVSFDKVNPSTMSLADVIKNLQAAGLGASEMMEVFGNRAGPTMAALLAVGSDAINQMTADLTGTNAAAEMAAINGGTVADALETVGSSAQTMAVTFVKEFQPAMKSAADILVQLINWISALPGPVKVFLGVVAVGIPLIGGLAAAISAIGAAVSTALGPIALIVGAVGAVIAIGSAIAKASDTGAIELEKLRGATDRYRAADAELSKVKKELTENTDNLNEAERRTLDQRERLAKKELQYSLADQVKSLNDAAVATNEVNKKMEAQQKLYDMLDQKLKNVRDGTEQLSTRELTAISATKEWQAVYGARGTGFDSLVGIMSKLSAGINETTNRQKELTKAEEEGLGVLAQSVIDGNAQMDQIYKMSPAVWGLVRAKREQILAEQKANEEKARANKLTEEEKKRIEEANERRRQLTAEQKQANEDAEKSIKAYKEKLEDLMATEMQAIELERQRAIAEVEASKATRAEKEKLIAAINKYYDAAYGNAQQQKLDEYMTKITDQTKSEMDAIRARDEEMKKADQDMWDGIVENAWNAGERLLGLLGNLFSAMTEKRLDALDEQMQAEMEAAGVAEETKMEKLQRELAAAIAAGDAETVAAKQKEITRTQIELDYEKKRAKIRYDAEKTQWGLTLAQGISEGARAIISGFSTQPFIPAGLIAGALATALTGAQIAVIAANKPEPPSMDTGGMVLPGYPGGTVVTTSKNGAGELLLAGGDAGRAFLQEFAGAIAEQISKAGAGQPMVVQNILDGQVIAEAVAKYYNGGRVRLE